MFDKTFERSLAFARNDLHWKAELCGAEKASPARTAEFASSERKKKFVLTINRLEGTT
jgi:hypothetical protein